MSQIGIKIKGLFIITIIITSSFTPFISEAIADFRPPVNQSTCRQLRQLVKDLIDVTTNKTDSDGDGLFDVVETIIGTDPFEEDSDYDNLSDYDEVWNATDPINPDSNWDGIPDSIEMESKLNEDLDNDGEVNVWDFDNDGDMVNDAVDLSPFAFSEINESFHIDLELNGNPTSLSFHVRPEDPDHLRLYYQKWDWPDDKQGQMRDLDSSSEDVIIRPVLNITGNFLPEQEDVLIYGIQRKGNHVIVPLFPVEEYGEIVAYNAKMLYPVLTPESLSLDIKLVWQVLGFTESLKMVSLLAPNEKYLSICENGEVKAIGERVTEKETFLYVESGKCFGLLTLDGFYLSVNTSGILVADSYDMNKTESFELIKAENGIRIKAHNGMYLSLQEDNSLAATSPDIGPSSIFIKTNEGFFSSILELACYPENFRITGLTIVEDYGFKIGLFFSDDFENTLAANLAIQYEYLYNGKSNISDINTILTEHELNISQIIEDFAYKDQSYPYLINEMIPQALSSLPNNKTLPLIQVFEDSLTSIDLSDFSDNYIIINNNLTYDIASKEVLTIKTSKTDWYNIRNNCTLDLDEIIQEIENMGYSENVTCNLITFELKWWSGEQIVSKIGDTTLLTEDPPEMPIVIDVIQKIHLGEDEWDFLKKSKDAVTNHLSWYKEFKFIDKIKVSWEGSKTIQILNRMKHFIAQTSFTKTISKISKLIKASKMFKILKFVGSAIPIIGDLFELGFGVYALFVIVNCADWGPLGKSIEIMKVRLQLCTGVLLLTVGIIIAIEGGPIGLAIDLVLAGILLLLALIPLDDGSILDYIFEAIASVFVNLTSEVKTSIDFINDPEVRVYDKDSNGIDVGDKIEYLATVRTKVYCKKGREGEADPMDLVKDSYLRWKYEAIAPAGSEAKIGIIDQWDNASISYPAHTRDYAEKTFTYDIGAWIEPDIYMCNFPITYKISGSFKLFYEEREWTLIPWWSYDIKSYEGPLTIDNSNVVIYYDIMPSSLDDFLDWKVLTPLDYDCDGLLNSEEPGREWCYDYDGDGLNDKYELEVASDPTQQDTDRDGLMDYYEILYKTNVTDADTDDDGLKDYTEVAGWLIDFSYAGKNFTIHVSSDPKLNDTDGDGVNDEWEYYSDLNPRSLDTNGDGIADVGIDYSKIKVEFVTKWEYPACVEFPHSDIAIDQNNGFIYVTSMFWSPYISPAHDPGIMKYHLNGTFISFIPVVTSYYLLGGAIAVDPNGDLYYGFPYNPDSTRPEFCIQKFDPSGNLLTNITFLEYDLITAVAVDGEGYIYIGGWNTQVKKYSSTGQLISSESDFVVPGEFLGVPDIAIDDKTGYVYVVNAWIDGLSPKSNVVIFNSSGKYIDSLPFWYPIGVAVDQDSNVYMIDRSYTKIHKFDPNWNLITSWGEYGSNDGQFIDPFSICVDLEGNIYVTSDNFLHPGYIHKFSQENIPARPIHEDTTSDRDGDGLNNTLEENGWGITFTNTTGTFSLHVTSDPYLNDTDFDGFTDYHEYQWLTNPRDPDTDDDGLCDYNEWKGYPQQTNSLHHDTDQDGLSDGTEITYGSNPSEPDTDGDGLTDLEEFNLKSSSKKKDTDMDGVNDKDEKEIKSDLMSPDTDGDLMFDGLEYYMGTDVTNNDTDGDELLDGYELYQNTNPLNNDTDGDKLPDGFEVRKRLNPLNNDTDGDGLLDFIEIQNGTNPLNPDTDMDGIPDSKDTDSNKIEKMNITIAYEDNFTISGYLENLALYSNLSHVNQEELIGLHSNDPYILLIGGEGGEVTTLIEEILQDTPDVLQELKNGTRRTATRYGLWTDTQTFYITWNPSPMLYISTLDAFRRKTVTIGENSITANYTMSLKIQVPESEENNNTITYDLLQLDEIDGVKQTDSTLYAVLVDSVNPIVKISKFNETTTPFNLTNNNGLPLYEYSLGKYLNLTHWDSKLNTSSELVDAALIQIYYRESELDRTGDGLANDPTDLDENTLSLYYLDDLNNWVKLTEDLDWIYDIGVNTTDIYLYGENYDGYIWALTGHLSLFGAAASTFNQPPDVTNAYPSRSTLWPPNGKYVNVTVEGVTDPDGDNVTITITGVTSDEPSASAKGSGGKEHAPDAAGVGTDTASLRAERSGKGNGRVYVIHFLACDGRGGETTGSVFVCVPHDVRKGDIVCVDDGQLYDATAKN